jgi:hypothetical protein
MTSRENIWNRVRIGTAIAAALAVATAGAIAVAGVANGDAVRGPAGFGGAVRVAVGQVAAKLGTDSGISSPGAAR